MAAFPDPDDLIFPRAATRVGLKYQANCPPIYNRDADRIQNCKWSSDITLGG